MKARPNFKLKAAITGKGYLLKDFAIKAKVHPKTLSQIVSGRYIPTDEIDKKLAAALGITKRKLIGLLNGFNG